MPPEPVEADEIAPDPPVRGVAVDIALNTAFPALIYVLARRYGGASERAALTAAAGFPLARALLELARRRSIDPISVIVFCAIVFTAICVSIGGSPRLLLIRESFINAMFGIACFASLLRGRPLMFFVGRYFHAGASPRRRAEFNASWNYPDGRAAHRLITIVWGTACLMEFAIRCGMALTLPSAWVLALSPIVLGSITVGTLIWTFWYARRARRRVFGAAGDGVVPRN